MSVSATDRLRRTIVVLWVTTLLLVGGGWWLHQRHDSAVRERTGRDALTCAILADRGVHPGWCP